MSSYMGPYDHPYHTPPRSLFQQYFQKHTDQICQAHYSVPVFSETQQYGISWCFPFQRLIASLSVYLAAGQSDKPAQGTCFHRSLCPAPLPGAYLSASPALSPVLGCPFQFSLIACWHCLERAFPLSLQETLPKQLCCHYKEVYMTQQKPIQSFPRKFPCYLGRIFCPFLYW